MMYDTFHAHIEEKDPRAALREWADVLVHGHVSESDRSAPGAGQVGMFENEEQLARDGAAFIRSGLSAA